MRTLMALALLAFGTESRAAPVSLKGQAEAFSGQSVSLDPRLPVPACTDGIDIAWRSDTRSSLVARCAATGWSLVIPTAAERSSAFGRAPPIVRRGQPVQVMASGNGFRVLVEGVADQDGRAGERVVVRNLRSGRRMVVDIRTDGALILAGHAEAPAPGP